MAHITRLGTDGLARMWLPPRLQPRVHGQRVRQRAQQAQPEAHAGDRRPRNRGRPTERGGAWEGVVCLKEGLVCLAEGRGGEGGRGAREGLCLQVGLPEPPNEGAGFRKPENQPPGNLNHQASLCMVPFLKGEKRWLEGRGSYMYPNIPPRNGDQS